MCLFTLLSIDVTKVQQMFILWSFMKFFLTFFQSRSEPYRCVAQYQIPGQNPVLILKAAVDKIFLPHGPFSAGG